jgi:hypothetical protein
MKGAGSAKEISSPACTAEMPRRASVKAWPDCSRAWDDRLAAEDFRRLDTRLHVAATETLPTFRARERAMSAKSNLSGHRY